MDVLAVIGGLVLLAAGGEGLVRAAVVLARRSGLPTLLVGTTIVAAATSMPELVVSVEAALDGAPAIAVGNVLGSNIANIALGNLAGSNLFNLLGILGATALVAPIPLDTAFVLSSGGVMLGLAAVSAPWLTGRMRIGRLAGASLLIAYVAYIMLSTGLIG